MSHNQALYYYFTTLGIGLYRVFKTLIFSLFALYNPGVNCRHTPTCSVYATTVIMQQGFIRGGLLALKRLLSCHPFHFKKEKLV